MIGHRNNYSYHCSVLTCPLPLRQTRVPDSRATPTYTRAPEYRLPSREKSPADTRSPATLSTQSPCILDRSSLLWRDGIRSRERSEDAAESPVIKDGSIQGVLERTPKEASLRRVSEQEPETTPQLRGFQERIVLFKARYFYPQENSLHHPPLPGPQPNERNSYSPSRSLPLVKNGYKAHHRPYSTPQNDSCNIRLVV